MKKQFLVLAIALGLSVIASAQVKKTKPDTVKYEYFVKVSIKDYNQIVGSLAEYKGLQMYSPSTTDAQKVAMFRGIETYLKELPGRVKLDSVKIKK